MIEIRTTIETSLGLILTPRIDLSLKVLAMNIAQIEEQLKEIAETNPIAKMEDDIRITKKTPINNDNSKEVDESFKEFFHQDLDSVSDIIEATASKEENIYDILMRQLTMEIDLDEKDLNIAKEIIYNINEKGFLEIPLEKITEKTNSSLERVEFLRKNIMKLEPIGCSALNTKEFLLLQAEEEGLDIQSVQRIIDAIDDINKPNIEKIKEQSGLDNETFILLFTKIKGFLLYPLESYQIYKDQDYIEPDVHVKKIEGKLVAILEDSVINKLTIDEDLLKEYLKDQDAKKFAEEKYREVKEFILAVSHRNKTLLKTVNIILQKQRQFFEDGTIKPLTRKEIAALLGFNVSTITRAVANKYILFEGKIIPLSKFFSSGVSENVSKEHVKSMIKNMVNQENKTNPLSDDQIKSNLEKMGIKLTRRTITKYRKEMNIPSSRERKCQDIQLQ